MGIKIPLTKKKGGDKVADNPPPVFNKHAEGEELLKGHKTQQTKKLSNRNLNDKEKENQKERAPSVGSNHSTSSTSLWIAASNAQAQKQGRERRVSDGDVVNRRKYAAEDSNEYEDEVEDDDFYEEEIIEEEFIEEEIIDELPPRKITIRFDEFDEMQTILHINDYTRHEISRAWYKRDDYDKMVALARKTAEKVEERTQELGRKIDKSSRKKIEYRGLEAWTSVGAAKVKIIKESAVEAVWNEQSRQWDSGINDVEKIRQVYQVVSRASQQTAQDRGFSDELIAKRIRQLEAEEKEKKRNRKLLGKSKALLGKSVKVTAGGVVKTAKLGVKTTKLTGKVALASTRLAKKTAVATATLDRKMLKEAFVPGKKKRECETQLIRKPSQANMTDAKDSGEYHEEESQSIASETSHKKKKSKLKLLGVVPIPGTHKTYREDRRQERIEKRIEKQKTRPSWEQNVSAGKY